MKKDTTFRVYLNSMGAMDDVNHFLAEHPDYKVSMIHSCAVGSTAYAIVVCTPVVK